MGCVGCTFARYETVSEVAAAYGCEAYDLALADSRQRTSAGDWRTQPMTITETTTIAEIASALPASVRVFQRHNIDFCCGGKKPIEPYAASRD